VNKKTKILISTSLLSFMFMFSFASVALAVDAPGGGTVESSGIEDMDDVVELIEAIAGWFQVIVLALAVFMIIWSGFTWMTAGGDDEKLGEARQRLIYALVGIAVVVVAYGLVALMTTLVGSN